MCQPDHLPDFSYWDYKYCIAADESYPYLYQHRIDQFTIFTGDYGPAVTTRLPLAVHLMGVFTPFPIEEITVADHLWLGPAVFCY